MDAMKEGMSIKDYSDEAFTGVRQWAGGEACQDCGKAAIVLDWIIEGEFFQRVGSWAACTCKQRKAALDVEISRSVLLPEFKRMTFANFEKERQPEAFAAMWNYADNWEENRKKGQWMIVKGPWGTGKTHLAAAIVNEIMPRGTFCIQQSVVEMFQIIKNHNKWKSLEIVANCNLLVMDEFGRGKLSDWDLEGIFFIVNSRYNKSLPTIFTTNYSSEVLSRRVDGAVVDRIAEKAIAVKMRPGSYRVKDRAEAEK